METGASLMLIVPLLLLFLILGGESWLVLSLLPRGASWQGACRGLCATSLPLDQQVSPAGSPVGRSSANYEVAAAGSPAGPGSADDQVAASGSPADPGSANDQVALPLDRQVAATSIPAGRDGANDQVAAAVSSADRGSANNQVAAAAPADSASANHQVAAAASPADSASANDQATQQQTMNTSESMPSSPGSSCGQDPYVNESAPGPQIRKYYSQSRSREGGPSLPRRVVLGFHGEFLRMLDKGCSDFFVSQENIKRQIIRPLRDRGVEVVIYLHTVYLCERRNQALLDALQPAKHNFSPTKLIWDSYLEVLKLIAMTEPASNSTAVILLRYDVHYRVPVIDLDIKWEAVNLPFRDLDYKWLGCNMVSDLFHVFPLRFLPTVQASFTDDSDAAKCGDNRVGSVHHAYNFLHSRLGAERISFISPGCFSSRLAWPWQPEGNNTFLGISRVCSRREHHCD